MSFLSGLWEVFKFVSWLLPVLKTLYRQYERFKSSEEKEELKAALLKAVETGDNRELEILIGNPNAGKPTKHNIPDLKTRPAKDRGNQ
jgi:hypothetical protein